MPVLSEDRVRVLAIVHALKAIGIRVKNWKNFLNGDAASEEALGQEVQVFAFGRDLQLLPQHHLAELDGTVPLFLVEACEYLSQHLHTEGLFRKTGSVGRIRALKAEVEQGGRIFSPPRVTSLQPCDVASLLKQFLRELPRPLIPVELQGPLCQAQTFEPQQGRTDRATLLLTALLPPARARVLRYLCSFLSQVAKRCPVIFTPWSKCVWEVGESKTVGRLVGLEDGVEEHWVCERGSFLVCTRCTENRMEVGNLAVVMAPNLLQCPVQSCRLTVHTERELDQQAAAVRALILLADRIGVAPSFVMDTLRTVEMSESSSPADGTSFSKRTGLSVYKSLRRQRRKSVGEIFVDALSKLKPGRTQTGPPVYLDAVLGQPLFKSPTPSSKSPIPQSPSAVKRKASEETVLEVDGSAKKRYNASTAFRRSLHDLRDDGQSVCSHSPEGSPSIKKNSKEDLHPISKRRSQLKGHRKSQRPPVPEGSSHRRKRSLRFFTMSSSSNSGPVPSVNVCSDSEESLSAGKKLQDKIKGSSDTAMGPSLSVPFILINEPGTVVIGSEVEDDPDLLNCSFAEKPDDVLCPSDILCDPQDTEEPCDDQWVLLEDANSEMVVNYEILQPGSQHEPQEAAGSPCPGDLGPMDGKDIQPSLEGCQHSSSSRSGFRPRRSISMPEVSLEHCTAEAVQLQSEAGTKESAFASTGWSASVSVPMSAGLGTWMSAAGGKRAGGTEKGEGKLGRRHGTPEEGKKDKPVDPELGLKRRQRRLSVAERLRGFGALALLLRTPQPPPQLGPVRSSVRLRRQGARRFSRSFSQDEVPVLLVEHSSFMPEEEPQAYVDLNDTHIVVEPFAPSDEGFLDATGCSMQELDTLVFHSPPDQTPSPEDQTLLGSVTLEEEQHVQAGGPELLNEPQSVCVLSESACAPVAQGHESEFEFDLHEMMEQQCHVADHEKGSNVLSQSPGNSHLDVHYDVFTSPHQQREPPSSPLYPCSFSTLKAEPLSPLYNSYAEQCPGPDANPPYEAAPCTDIACLSYDGLLSINSSMSEKFSLSLDLSPAAFQFRSQGSRRRYRDSPRWPSHEARLTTWKPSPF